MSRRESTPFVQDPVNTPGDPQPDTVDLVEAYVWLQTVLGLGLKKRTTS